MKNETIAIIDAETDPFLHGRAPRPFVFGYFDGDVFLSFWGEDCVQQLVACIRERRPRVVFAHNGGKFDFMFLLAELTGNLTIINSRIAKARIGETEIRDSWCILPFALEKFDKGKINYDIFERSERERPKNRNRILRYLERDCRSLFTLVAAFRDRFGTRLTVASSGMGEVRARHDFPNTSERHDARFRPFYFGGRVQCFETGHLRGNWKLYDVNSMYPWCMANCWHPRGTKYSEFGEKDFWRFVWKSPYPWFATVEGYSRGAFPLRGRDGRLGFPDAEGRYLVSSHEFHEALSRDLFRGRVISVLQCEDRVHFDKFVADLYAERLDHKTNGRLAQELGAKYVLNAPYGKFAQNPDNHAEYRVRRPGDAIPGAPRCDDPHPYSDWPRWDVHTDYGDSGEIWTRPVPPHGRNYFDVAIAASITGAARAILMRAISIARRPIYCDTDSILAEELPGASVNASKLGDWKLEATATEAIIAGRKLYSLWNGRKLVKSSAKGIQKDELTKLDWRRLISGECLESSNPAPNFKLDGSVKFTKRSIRYVRP